MALWVTANECILSVGLKRTSHLDRGTCPCKEELTSVYSTMAVRLALHSKRKAGIGVHFERWTCDIITFAIN